MYNNNSNIRNSLIFDLFGNSIKMLGSTQSLMTLFLFTGICDTMCLYIKVSVTFLELVFLINNFTDNLSLPFQKSSPIQISILSVIPQAWSLILRGMRWSHWSARAYFQIFSLKIKQFHIQVNFNYSNRGADILQGS